MSRCAPQRRMSPNASRSVSTVMIRFIAQDGVYRFNVGPKPSLPDPMRDLAMFPSADPTSTGDKP